MAAAILTILIGILCGVDLWLKSYMETHLQQGEERKVFGGKIALRRVHNRGMAMNRGETHPRVVKFLSASVTIVLVIYYLFLLRKKEDWFCKTGVALAIAGGISNSYDRFVRKYVVDYFGVCTKWKKLEKITFNLGDLFIFLGGIFLILSEFFREKR